MTWSTHRISFYHGPTSNGLWGGRCSCGARFVGSQEGAENWAATHDLNGECLCCGKTNIRLFLVQKHFMGEKAEWLMCADCATEEQEIEYHERERHAP